MHFQIKNNDYKNSIDLAKKIKTGLEKAGWKDDSKSSNLICIGGDGTVLKAVSENNDKIDDLVVYAIHSGGLGFYTDFRNLTAEEIVDIIVNNKAKLRKFSTIDVVAGEQVEHVINEVQLLSPLHPTKFRIEVDGQRLQKFRSTGIIVSTPTGSTGAMKSFGGAIIDPKIKAFEIAEIAACSNNVYRSIGSPIVVSEDSEIKIMADFHETRFAGDGHNLNIVNPKEIIIKKGKQITFARHKENDFFERVHRSFVMEGNNE